MKKDIIITFRTTAKLKEKMKLQSEKAHMSKYIERLLLNKNITVIEEGHNIYFELNRIGNNLNQIAKNVNLGIATNRDIENLNEISRSLKDIWKSINALLPK